MELKNNHAQKSRFKMPIKEFSLGVKEFQYYCDFMIIP